MLALNIPIFCLIFVSFCFSGIYEERFLSMLTVLCFKHVVAYIDCSDIVPCTNDIHAYMSVRLCLCICVQ